jgi:hypothetical protein
LATAYRRDLWKDAEHYVEIWVEKDALAGVLVEETAPRCATDGREGLHIEVVRL